MAARDAIGHCVCPWCGSERMRVSEGGRENRAYVTCNACKFQGFARGKHADVAIRSKMVSQDSNAAG